MPDYKVLCMAEVCNQTFHNLIPPRGAEVRDVCAMLEEHAGRLPVDCIWRRWKMEPFSAKS